MGSCDWFKIADLGWQMKYSTWVYVFFLLWECQPGLKISLALSGENI